MAWASPPRLLAGPSAAAALHASPQSTRDGVAPCPLVRLQQAKRRGDQPDQSPRTRKHIFTTTSQLNTDEKQEAAPRSPPKPAQIYRYPRPNPPEVTPFHQIRPGCGTIRGRGPSPHGVAAGRAGLVRADQLRVRRPAPAAGPALHRPRAAARRHRASPLRARTSPCGARLGTRCGGTSPGLLVLREFSYSLKLLEDGRCGHDGVLRT